MRIGAARLELFLADCDSIKGRRRVARSIIDRVRQRFEVSIADVGNQDDRHRIFLGIAVVGVDPRHVDARLERVVEYVEGLGLAEVVDEERGVARLDELDGDERQRAAPDRDGPDGGELDARGDAEYLNGDDAAVPEGWLADEKAR